jgi:hypothetical protein
MSLETEQGLPLMWMFCTSIIKIQLIYDFHYLDSEGELIQSQELTTIKDTPFRIIVSKVDYQLPIQENLKVSTGVKAVNSLLSKTM